MNESSLENMITLMDREGDGRVSEFEFLVYVMTNTGLAKRDTLEEIQSSGSSFIGSRPPHLAHSALSTFSSST